MRKYDPTCPRAGRRKRGFTLIEAILVAIIVGLLASVGVIKAGDARGKVLDEVRREFILSLNVNIQRAAITDKPFGAVGQLSKQDFSGETDPDEAAFMALLHDLAAFGFYTQATYGKAERIIQNELAGSISVQISNEASVVTTDLSGVTDWGQLEILEAGGG